MFFPVQMLILFDPQIFFESWNWSLQDPKPELSIFDYFTIRKELRDNSQRDISQPRQLAAGHLAAGRFAAVFSRFSVFNLIFIVKFSVFSVKTGQYYVISLQKCTKTRKSAEISVLSGAKL